MFIIEYGESYMDYNSMTAMVVSIICLSVLAITFVPMVLKHTAVKQQSLCSRRGGLSRFIP
jgi:hypothetical protein